MARAESVTRPLTVRCGETYLRLLNGPHHRVSGAWHPEGN